MIISAALPLETSRPASRSPSKACYSHIRQLHCIGPIAHLDLKNSQHCYTHTIALSL